MTDRKPLSVREIYAAFVVHLSKEFIIYLLRFAILIPLVKFVKQYTNGDVIGLLFLQYAKISV
jgi:hypothetical protein